MKKETLRSFIIKTNFDNIDNVNSQIKNEFEKIYNLIETHNFITKEELNKIMNDNISYIQSGEGDTIRILINLFKTENNQILGILLFTTLTNLFKE